MKSNYDYLTTEMKLLRKHYEYTNAKDWRSKDLRCGILNQNSSNCVALEHFGV